MRKLSLELDSLAVQSFEVDAGERGALGTVLGHQKKTGLQDTNCSAIDRCPSARGCTFIDCPTPGCDTYDPELCPSVIDACPSQRGCSDLFAC